MQTVPALRTAAEKTRHGKKWLCTHRLPPGPGWLTRLARRERHRISICGSCGTPPPLNGCWIFVLGCGCIYVVSGCALTRLLPRRLWPADRGGLLGKGFALHFLSCPLATTQVEAWLEVLLLLLALAGPAGYFKNAVLRRRLGCYVADCACPSQIKPDIERSGPAPTAFRRAGWPGESGTGAPSAALWPSWCDTGGPPSLLRPASSRAQPVPRGQTIWSTDLSGLDRLSDTTTRLCLFSGPLHR